VGQSGHGGTLEVDLGHKVAVMVRLIGAAVNETDRPRALSAGRNHYSG
jgi:hypothetical protein